MRLAKPVFDTSEIFDKRVTNPGFPVFHMFSFGTRTGVSSACLFSKTMGFVWNFVLNRSGWGPWWPGCVSLKCLKRETVSL